MSAEIPRGRGVGVAVRKLRYRLGPRGRQAARVMADALGGGVLGSVVAADHTAHVALTFDDGPDSQVTPSLLDLLSELGVHASFFLLTNQARAFPELVEGIVAGGHEVGLHGRDHRRITSMNGTDARNYLRDARDELEQFAARPVRWYRPPYGAQSVTSLRAVRGTGLESVVWNADAQDWTDRPVGDVIGDGLRECTGGGILLLHERLEPDLPRAAPTTSFDRVEMAAGLIAGLRERELVPTTVSGLLAAGRVRKSVWLRP